MNLPSNVISLTLFAIVVITITVLMIKSISLSYFKTSKHRKEMMTLLKVARIENSSDFLSGKSNCKKGIHDQKCQSSFLCNEDLFHYSISLCDFFSKFDCRNFPKLRGVQNENPIIEKGNGKRGEVEKRERGKKVIPREIIHPLKTNTLFVLPNGAAINKNFFLSQHELDTVWGQKSDDSDNDNENDSESLLPFRESTCAQNPFIFVDVFGTYGNEKNFRTRPQKTVCGCERHIKLFVFPMTPTATTSPQFELKINTPGLNVLRFPFPGVKPLIEKISNSSSNRYLLNTGGEIIFSDPCSQLDNGNHFIDDTLIKYSEVNALRTKRPQLFERFMETRQTPRQVNCKNQQVHELL